MKLKITLKPSIKDNALSFIDCRRLYNYVKSTDIPLMEENIGPSLIDTLFEPSLCELTMNPLTIKGSNPESTDEDTSPEARPHKRIKIIHHSADQSLHPPS